MKRWIALAALVLAASRLAGAGPDFATVEAVFKKEFKSAKYESRLKAFDLLLKSKDLRAADTLISAAMTVSSEQDAIRKAQEETEAKLESTLYLITVENDEMAVVGTVSAAQLLAYNKKVSKLESDRDTTYARQRDLAAQASRLSALADAATTTLGSVLTNFDPPDLVPALDKVSAAWSGPKATPTDRLRAADVFARVKKPEAGLRLRDYALDPTEEGQVRSAALSARVAREDAGAFEDVLTLLAQTAAPWEVRAEAIDSLQRIRKREGIEPLIAFLGQDGTGRLREDATRALRALTGQTHGPYQEPWKTWWEGAKAMFVVPPVPPVVLAPAADKGVTFYGITTFSERVLFILDISGSMTGPADPTGEKLEPTKIAVAKKELNGAIDMLDDNKRFNLLVFGHTVVRYKPGMIVADKISRDHAKRFVADLKPAGGTNIHDALETGFRMAGTSEGKTYAAMIDTIFFLTDGTPTAGKITDPKAILETVRGWNKSAHLTIHCVGIGDCDEEFLKSLAQQSGGQYVRR